MSSQFSSQQLKTLLRPNENWTRRGLVWHSIRTWGCAHGLHRSRFHYDLIPCRWDPPEPPEDAWGCDYCGKVFAPRWWPLADRTWWRVQQWWYERPGGRFEREMSS